jgi:hypothetical protein
MPRPSHSWTPFGAEKAHYIKDLVETRSTIAPFKSITYGNFADYPHVVPHVGGRIHEHRSAQSPPTTTLESLE